MNNKKMHLRCNGCLCQREIVIAKQTQREKTIVETQPIGVTFIFTTLVL